MTWFLILVLVAVGGWYLYGHRSHATVPSQPTYPGRDDEPRGQTGAVSQNAHDAPNKQESRKHGGCC